ncbi:MAG: zinc-binding dehydrogenase [Coriobacteriia bacterium]|nr:zinc-binding dehydrogenase [Coriobacteriia bacterium]
MKAIVIEEPGGPEKLLYREVPTPQVKPGWTLVHVRGFGINHSEVFTRQGLSPSVQFPRILGIECVGEVAQTTDPERLPVGQKCVSLMGEMGRAFDGGYAEYCLLPNSQVYPVETDLPWKLLAALPETYYTAFGSMVVLYVQEGDSILVRGATSGVGVAFLRLVRGRFPQAHVTGTTRNPDKVQMLLDAGFDEVVVDHHNVLQTDAEYDRVLELVGPASLRDTFKHVHEDSVVCVTGLLGGEWSLDFDPLEDQPTGSYLTSFHSATITEERLNALVSFVEANDVDVTPERVFTLEQVPDAHRYLESAHSYGKVVVVTDPADME